MAAGFLLYACYHCISTCGSKYDHLDHHDRQYSCHLFFLQTPAIFPLVIILGGIATNLSRKRIPQVEQKPTKDKMVELLVVWNYFYCCGYHQ